MKFVQKQNQHFLYSLIKWVAYLFMWNSLDPNKSLFDLLTFHWSSSSLFGSTQYLMNVHLCVQLFWSLNVSLQCFPEGTDMTSVLDLYFQVSVAVIFSFQLINFKQHKTVYLLLSFSKLLVSFLSVKDPGQIRFFLPILVTCCFHSLCFSIMFRATCVGVWKRKVVCLCSCH